MGEGIELINFTGGLIWECQLARVGGGVKKFEKFNREIYKKNYFSVGIEGGSMWEGADLRVEG